MKLSVSNKTPTIALKEEMRFVEKRDWDIFCLTSLPSLNCLLYSIMQELQYHRGKVSSYLWGI